jgi:hypothetical protein
MTKISDINNLKGEGFILLKVSEGSVCQGHQDKAGMAVHSNSQHGGQKARRGGNTGKGQGKIKPLMTCPYDLLPPTRPHLLPFSTSQ